ncbi:hypothetical protein V6C03_04230 [Methyloligella sp. 2.7D]|uniref:hypothetical protein n=1 Tax=unclassified Methyloligella TaxID=2625955 RepID=UPI00157D8607|nr:hypothetical protein [Methyloligella sp. GL2]QKP76189.1 hypothetical protein HT051_01200 [Methyloligella sp. GL2]
MSKVTRRAFIGLAGVATVAVVGYGGAMLACRGVPRHNPDFFAGLDDEPLRQAAQEVGRRVLAEYPELVEDRALKSFLAARPRLAEAATVSCPDTRRRLVQDQCGADFAAGEARVLDGWVMSETELRLCGMAAKYA